MVDFIDAAIWTLKSCMRFWTRNGAPARFQVRASPVDGNVLCFQNSRKKIFLFSDAYRVSNCYRFVYWEFCPFVDCNILFEVNLNRIREGVFDLTWTWARRCFEEEGGSIDCGSIILVMCFGENPICRFVLRDSFCSFGFSFLVYIRFRWYVEQK